MGQFIRVLFKLYEIVMTLVGAGGTCALTPPPTCIVSHDFEKVPPHVLA